MSEPLISIVIPTRERCATLGASIMTALDQDLPEMEVIVSDNVSEDATAEIVRTFRDPRLIYIRPARRLSMCDHWEFALKHARGTYVIFFGDDDGIMPSACRTLSNLFKALPSPIYYWGCHSYIWPGSLGGPAVFSNLSAKAPRAFDLLAKAKKAMRSGSRGWESLPKLYHSAVARRLLDELRAKTGRVFHSTQPDVFLAFALPGLSARAVDVGTCLTVSGRSAASIGFAALTGGNKVMQTFINEYGDSYRMDASLSPLLPEGMRWIADAMLVAKRLFPEAYRGVEFNYTAIYAIWAANQSWRDPRTLLRTIQARNSLRRFHRFDMANYLAFYLRIKGSHLRDRLRRRFSKAANKRADIEPADVRECVKVLAELGQAV